jgi:hypothetical protein
MLPDDTAQYVAALMNVCPDVVLATWGATARGEMTRLSDVDLFCWNPLRVALPPTPTEHMRYLDLVTCDGDKTDLRSWALSNATDLHAVMFARRLGHANDRTADFAQVVRSLWRDDAVRAREVYHLVASSLAIGRRCTPGAHRPEKFTLGGSRCWSVLAECGQLATGKPHADGTDANLRRLAASGLVSAEAADSFDVSMRLRRECEDRSGTFSLVSAEFDALGHVYTRCVRELLENVGPWLDRHAPLTQATRHELQMYLENASGRAAPRDEPDGSGETDAMMRAFLTLDASELRYLLAMSSFRSSWWLRHAALLNADCPPEYLGLIVDGVIASGRWWADRNLILYAVRHPRADQALCDRLRAVDRMLRPMDRAALNSWYSTAHLDGSSR